MLTNFPYGVSSFGVPMLGTGIGANSGKYIFVDAVSGNDGNDGASTETAVKTFAQAYSMVTTNKNDTIVLAATSTSYDISAMVDASKSRFHVVGMGNYGAFAGQRVKLNMGVTTATTDLYAVKITGVGQTWSNIKFISENTLAEHLAPVYFGGEACVFNNCSTEFIAQVDQTDNYDAIFASDTNTFNNCKFGTTTILKTAARHTVLFGVSAALPAKDNFFNNCTFCSASTSASSVFIKAGTADCINFNNYFRGTIFSGVVNAGVSALAPTVCVATNTSITGKLIFDANTFIGVGSKLAASTLNVGVWINAPSTPTANTSGVAVLGA
jgi:hypothetical protein